MLLRVSILLRALTLAFAVLQASTPAAAAIADARFQQEARPRAGAHVEDRSQSDCPPAHELDCVLCSHLTHGGAPPADPVQLVAAAERVGCAAGAVHHPSGHARSTTRARAPPGR